MTLIKRNLFSKKQKQKLLIFTLALLSSFQRSTTITTSSTCVVIYALQKC